LSTKCTRRGLPVVPALVLTDYKSQSKTFAEVLLMCAGNTSTTVYIRALISLSVPKV
jgi:hypothetical protein